MQNGRWVIAKVDKKCSCCDAIVKIGHNYMQARFIINYGDTNITKLLSYDLCQPCINSYEDMKVVDESIRLR